MLIFTEEDKNPIGSYIDDGSGKLHDKYKPNLGDYDGMMVEKEKPVEAEDVIFIRDTDSVNTVDTSASFAWDALAMPKNIYFELPQKIKAIRFTLDDGKLKLELEYE